MPDFELVMPFVVTDDRGGPYQGEAYVAGYEAGRIDVLLYALPADQPTYVCVAHPGNQPQLDLIAMNRGFTLVWEWADDDSEWIRCHFRRTSPIGQEKP